MVACQTENSPIWPADSVNSTGFVIFAAWMDYLRKQFARPLLVNSRHCKTLHYHSLRNFQHERRIFDDISGNFIVNELFALSSFPLALPPFLLSVTSLVFLLLLSLSRLIALYIAIFHQCIWSLVTYKLKYYSYFYLLCVNMISKSLTRITSLTIPLFQIETKYQERLQFHTDFVILSLFAMCNPYENRILLQ